MEFFGRVQSPEQEKNVFVSKYTTEFCSQERYFFINNNSMDQKQVRFRALSTVAGVAIVVFLIAIFFGIKSRNIPENVTQTTNDTISQTAPAKTLVYLIVEGPQKTVSYDIPATEIGKAIDVLRSAEKQGLVLQSKDYGGELGIFIEGINGQANDMKNNLYWTLYVNNIQSATGASTATVNPGDTITWKFEKSKF
jgi:hypothetical protein